MGLGVALVDRARIIVNQSSGVKVQGTTVFAPTPHAWFKARLTLAAASEGTDDASTRRTTRQATLMTGVRDESRETLVLRSSDRIEVDSKALGRATYEISGDPEPIRKKRTLIGWTMNLALVDEHAFDPGMV